MKQAERQVTEGLSSGYRLEFGDTDDWIQLTTGEWLRGDLHWLRPKGLEAGQDVSFYSNKLVATGEGGMVVCDDETVADLVSRVRALVEGV